MENLASTSFGMFRWPVKSETHVINVLFATFASSGEVFAWQGCVQADSFSHVT